MTRLAASLTAVLLPAAVLVATPSSAAADSRAEGSAAVRPLKLRGHGYGHGIGMSQHGAQGAAIRGKSYRQILRFYYPGTKMGSAPKRIRVLITADWGRNVVVKARKGLMVRDRADDRVFELPRSEAINRWRIKPARGHPSVSVVQLHNDSGWHRWRVPGRRVLRGTGQFEAPGAMALVLPNGSTARYRGALRAAYPSGGSSDRATVNVLRMNKYLLGVVADEMPASWRRAALRSQAVAARTYAANIRRANRGEYYHICDTTACQVYNGVSAETRASNRAVYKTSGQIRVFRGRPALTMFSASSGGWTADGGLPYLRAKRDPFDKWSGNTVHTWSTRISGSRISSAYPSIGSFRRIRVLARDGHGQWGGRIQRLRVTGSAGSVRVSGVDFRFALGLRSTWFRVV
jgi:stage II sporulation protein D